MSEKTLDEKRCHVCGVPSNQPLCYQHWLIREATMGSISNYVKVNGGDPSNEQVAEFIRSSTQQAKQRESEK